MRIRAFFFLITSSLFFILYFVTSAAAQQEGAGNYISEIDGKTYTLNYEDKSRKRPNDDSIGRRYILQCDNRQENLIQKLINAPSAYVNGVLTSAGFLVCQTTTPDGYVVEPGEPGYVIPQFRRNECAAPPDSDLYQRRDQRVCDLIELEKKGVKAGKNIPPNPISGGQCVNAKGRKGTLPALIPFSNPESGKASLEPAPCGTTFDTYNPPKIACGEDGLEPGVWAPVRSDGAVFYPFVSDCLTSAPGGFNFACDLQRSGAPCGTAPANIKHVFLNPKDPVPSTENLSPSTRNIRRNVGFNPRYAQFKNQFTSLDVEYSEVEDPNGPASSYDFATGIYTNDQGKQFRDGIPMSGSGSSPVIVPPTGPGDSPAQAELARATAARQEAEQQLNNAQTVLESAAAAQQVAEQQLATAQITLASATEALQAAEQALQQAAEQQAAELAIAERAVQDAEQQSTSVDMELETAASSLVLLEQQVDNAQELVAKLEVSRDDALRILNEARARVAKITGGVGDIQDSATDTGTGPGSVPSGDVVASNNDWDCLVLANYIGPGTIIDFPGSEIDGLCLGIAMGSNARKHYDHSSKDQYEVEFNLDESDKLLVVLKALPPQPNGSISFGGQIRGYVGSIRIRENGITKFLESNNVLAEFQKYLDQGHEIVGKSQHNYNPNTGFQKERFFKIYKGNDGFIRQVEGSDKMFSKINALEPEQQYASFLEEACKRPTNRKDLLRTCAKHRLAPKSGFTGVFKP